MLPAQTYVKGFLRTYAEYLGLDGQLYVDEFSSRFVGDGPARTRRARGASPRVHQSRGIERKVLVARARRRSPSLTALVIVAWKFGGGDSRDAVRRTTQQPATTAHVAAGRGSELTGVQHGTYVEVRRGSPSGAVLLQATLAHGQVAARSTASASGCYVRRASGVRVSLGGKARRASCAATT